MRLHLGCSDDLKLRPWINVDIEEPWNLSPGYDFQAVDLTPRPLVAGTEIVKQWPWADSSITDILAHDVFEHIAGFKYPGNKGKIWCMNEAHRVLKPGGILDLQVPAVSLSSGQVNLGAFADPTHQSFWTLDDRYYFNEEWNNLNGERGRLGPAYGITALFRGQWELFEYGAPGERRAKIRAVLEAVK